MNARRTAGFALLGLLCAGGALLLLRPVPAPPPVLLHPSAKQVAVTEQHLATLNQAATRPGLGPRTVRLSESDLNTTLASSASLRKLLKSRGVEAVQIVLQEPNVVVIHASVRVQSHTQTVQVGGTLTPDPKTGIRFAASGAQAGRVPLPPAIVNAQADQIVARFSQPVLSRLALTVESVGVQKKDLVIVGLPNAKASPPTASPARH